jgi:hypothetical protein
MFMTQLLSPERMLEIDRIGLESDVLTEEMHCGKLEGNMDIFD